MESWSWPSVMINLMPEFWSSANEFGTDSSSAWTCLRNWLNLRTKSKSTCHTRKYNDTLHIALSCFNIFGMSANIRTSFMAQLDLPELGARLFILRPEILLADGKTHDHNKQKSNYTFCQYVNSLQRNLWPCIWQLQGVLPLENVEDVFAEKASPRLLNPTLEEKPSS